MDKEAVLKDLRSQFGRKSVLYADELAELLGKSEQALANLRHRGGLPFPIKKVGGRPAVALHDIADWLADGQSSQNKKPKSTSAPSGSQPVPSPARHRASLGKALLALRVQRDFLEEVFAQLEAIHLEMGLSSNKRNT